MHRRPFEGRHLVFKAFLFIKFSLESKISWQTDSPRHHALLIISSACFLLSLITNCCLLLCLFLHCIASSCLCYADQMMQAANLPQRLALICLPLSFSYFILKATAEKKSFIFAAPIVKCLLIASCKIIKLHGQLKSLIHARV